MNLQNQPQIDLLLSLFEINSFAITFKSNLSFINLLVCSIDTVILIAMVEFKRRANIFECIQVLIFRAAENYCSTVSIVAGLTRSNLQMVIVLGIKESCE